VHFVSEPGQLLVWVAVMLPLFLSVVGLAMDAGLVFAARRELQNAADGAARAGAMQIDIDAYRQSSGEKLVLDQSKALQAAAEYVANEPADMTATIEADGEGVLVEARRDVPTSFLQLIGVKTVQISATAPARPRYGIESGNR
jgi:Flp pilus assembly protein TadG